jgi:hypothetical protein
MQLFSILSAFLFGGLEAEWFCDNAITLALELI